MSERMSTEQYRESLKKGSWRRGLRRDGSLNKTETRFAGQLEEWRAAGLVRWWIAKPHSFRLADRCFWKPDFLVQWITTGHRFDKLFIGFDVEDTGLQIIDVKGGPVEDDTMVKLRVVAELYPCYLFSIVRWKQKSWEWQHL